ncbi:CehA/McbA family metallohydrolase [Alkalimonas delamerensis]|uniref:CehA/McbA family metallohydrolase n=1 Tax=Alkalimonas delamerensis TaxID=265981 RepID=A0ABT9GMD9_9GAMM|nr:CehA/McbA family metallohydrolase [Alkalimonas delamerensis]MDP4528140.1 CehA/McbA family metallohydrolase [Alkalimonas delamerensis]
MRKKLLTWLVRTAFIFAVLLVVIFWLLTTKGSVQQRTVASKDVVAAHNLFAATLAELRQASAGISIELEQSELDALLNVASHALRPVVFHGAILESSAVLHAVIELPGLFRGRVVHGHCWLSRQADGFQIESCQLGRMPFSGRLSMFMLRSGIRFFIDSPADDQLLTLFQHGRIAERRLSFTQMDAQAIRPRLAQRVYSGLSLGRDLSGGQQGLAPDVVVYLEQLETLAKANPDERRLAFFLQQLLLTAESRANGRQLEAQYHAALWALAVGFGNRSFIRYAHAEMQPNEVPALPAAVLAGRRDLTLHFLYSAVIKMVGNVHIAEQIGNLKELHDAGEGGTGFSFVDIAANKAGIWFVQHLNAIDIALAHQLTAEAFEMTFMPAVHDLPEGLREERFEQFLGGLQGEGTARLQAEIDRRLSQLALFGATLHPAVQLEQRPANLPPPNQTLIADLHIHSRFSDGSRHIDWLAQQAQQQGCDVIAITDHSDLSNRRFDEAAYLAAIQSARAAYLPMQLITGMEWNIPPMAGKEHVSLLLPQASEDADLLRSFRQRFDNEVNRTGLDASEALNWLKEHMPEAVLFYNHPSRKALSFTENLFDVRTWRKDHQTLLGFEGGPGHQRDKGPHNASYQWWYRTLHGWDPAVAVVGGQWDTLLQQGMMFWGALSNSDYHTHRLDYLPCKYSRTHLLVQDSTEQSIFAALRAGRFYGSQGNFLKELDFQLVTSEGVLYSGDEGYMLPQQRYEVVLDLTLQPRNYQGDPTWLDKVELVVIYPERVETVRLYPEIDGLHYRARWRGRLESDFVVVRARGGMELTDGRWHYFYTNPIRLRERK